MHSHPGVFTPQETSHPAVLHLEAPPCPRALTPSFKSGLESRETKSSLARPEHHPESSMPSVGRLLLFPQVSVTALRDPLRRITVQTTQQPLCYLSVTSLHGVINSPELNRSFCKLNSVGPEDCHYLNYIPEFSIHLLTAAAGPMWICPWTVMDGQSWSQQLAMSPSWLSLQEALSSLRTLPLFILIQSPR